MSDNGGVLGISNRTENWKTVQYYLRLREDACGGLCGFAKDVIKAAGSGDVLIKPDDVSVELFWKGFRDFVCDKSEGELRDIKKKAVGIYTEVFHGLRCEVKARTGIGVNGVKFRDLEDFNYEVKGEDDTSSKAVEDNFFNNLRNTEIDMVIHAKDDKECHYLLIGEAKYTQTFNADSKLVLVHQLIRQYVTATVLVKLCKGEYSNTKIIPFVLCDNMKSTKKSAQVQFMIENQYMSSEKVRGWDDPTTIASSCGIH